MEVVEVKGLRLKVRKKNKIGDPDTCERSEAILHLRNWRLLRRNERSSQ